MPPVAISICTSPGAGGATSVVSMRRSRGAWMTMDRLLRVMGILSRG